MTTADDALVSRLQEIIDSDSRAVLNHKNRIVAARHATAATTRHDST